MSGSPLRNVGLALAIVLSAAPAFALRVMDYNPLNYNGTTGRDAYYRRILANVQPDILVLEEIATDQAAVNAFKTNVLEVVNPGQWIAGPFTNGPDTDAAIFYRASACSLVAYVTIPTDLRNIYEWTVRPTGHSNPSTDFRLYAVHLKASQGSSEEAQRLSEVTSLRAQMETFPVGGHYAVMGDYNIYTATEPAYVYMTSPAHGLAGVLEDPIQREGNWHDDASFADIHTQSTRTTSFGGGATGGMDDRFDIILVSPSDRDGQGFDALPSTYTAFGQDGQHFNLAINIPPYSVVDSLTAVALWQASDHIPVFVDYQLPALMNVASSLGLGTAIVGGTASAILSVGDSAAPPADALDYSFAAPPGFSAPGGSFQAAPGVTNPHAIDMDTSTPGVKGGTLVISSDDPDRLGQNVALAGTVLAHAVPSADAGTQQLVAALDLGTVADPDTAAAVASVFDLGYGPLESALEVHAADLGGDPGFFLDGGFSARTAAAAPATYGVRFAAAGATSGVHTGTLVFHTRDLPGLSGALDRDDVQFDLTVTVQNGATGAQVAAAPPTRTGFVSLSPNPFRGEASVRFGLAAPERARIVVVDVAGRMVRGLLDRSLPAGAHDVSWDGRDAGGRVAAPGIYFVRLTAGNVAETRKIAHLR
ncbi:MAG: FlgD immunoglobulin-like domain containing protein [bacterium]